MLKYVRTTLVIIKRENEVLLGMKKRGLGVGKWNGFGGKLTAGETLKQCAARELNEECSLTVDEKDLQQTGILMFDFLGENLFIEVNVFKASKFYGIPTESEEMAPKWFLTENVPFDKLWADDVLWYPLLFQNKLFYGVFQFQGHDNMVFHDLKVVNCLNEMEEKRDLTRKEYSVDPAQILPEKTS